MFIVTREPLSVQQINDLVKRPTDGAVVTFDGIVRNNFDGRAVRYLDYEAYTEMAEKRWQKSVQKSAASFLSARSLSYTVLDDWRLVKVVLLSPSPLPIVMQLSKHARMPWSA